MKRLWEIKSSQLWIIWWQAYENFIQKEIEVTDNLIPSKNKHLKGALQDWFEAEIMEKINEKDKLFKKFKKPCLHIDKGNYKKARNEVQKLMGTKKKAYFERKLTEYIAKPKELWKNLKS